MCKTYLYCLEHDNTIKINTLNLNHKGGKIEVWATAKLNARMCPV